MDCKSARLVRLIAYGLLISLAGTAIVSYAGSNSRVKKNTPVWVKDFKNSPKIEARNIERVLNHYVKEPHPFGSKAQALLAVSLSDGWRFHGLQASVQHFESEIPNRDFLLSTKRESIGNKTKRVTGGNVVGIVPGTVRCGIVFGGHFDSKLFTDIHFVGANDGGSSTALIYELGRTIATRKALGLKPKSGSWGECHFVFALFDGEEAIMPEWTDGERATGVQDNLYGSRAFAEAINSTTGKYTWKSTPISFAFVIDMIGHVNQNLSITVGSKAEIVDALLAHKGDIVLNRAPITVEDDHIPLMRKGLPFVHIIDWSNLSEWHTAKDTLEIVSAEKIAALGKALLDFLDAPR